MSWPAYKTFIQRPGRTIGLAPLLDTPFNAARAPTKFFDITAAGAVGIYADSPVYRRLVEHGKNGLLLPMDSPGGWVEAVLEHDLANDEAKMSVEQHSCTLAMQTACECICTVRALLVCTAPTG